MHLPRLRPGPDGQELEFSRLARDAARRLYPNIAGNPDCTAVINDAHYQRLSGYVADAQAKGAQVETAAEPAEGRSERKLPLTVVLDPTDDMKVLQEEIFGPVLPVLGYRSIGEAVEYVNDRPRPLALYLVSNQESSQSEVLAKTTSGGVSLNDTMLHYLQDDLPFGGIGPSGMGSYHGHEGFDTFSHMKAVFRQRGLGSRTGAQLLYPPYGPVAGLLIRLMRRIYRPMTMTAASPLLTEPDTDALAVVLIDRDRLFSRGLELLLDALSGGRVRVVGSVDDSGRAVDLVRRQRPDVALVGLSLAPPGGLAAVGELKRACPGVRVLVLAGNEDVGATVDALRAGADGLLLKSSPPDVLLAPLLALASGLSVLPPNVLEALVEAPIRRDLECLHRLTAEERDLWRLVAEGLETHDICRVLFLAERTAKRKLASLLRKLGVTNRVQAAALAGRCGLLDQPV